MPTTELSEIEKNQGIGLLDLMLKCNLIPSKGEGRRLVIQGGVYINDVAVSDPAKIFTKNDLIDGEAVIRKGKKTYHRII